MGLLTGNGKGTRADSKHKTWKEGGKRSLEGKGGKKKKKRIPFQTQKGTIKLPRGKGEWGVHGGGRKKDLAESKPHAPEGERWRGGKLGLIGAANGNQAKQSKLCRQEENIH